MTTTDTVLRGRLLRRGQRVAVVSPSGPLPVGRRADLDAGLDKLRLWGLEPQLGPHALDRIGFLAGNDADRLADLQHAIADPEVRAIFCVRGGYGVTRILEQVDFAPLAKDPKPIIGFSDITALLAAAYRQIGLVGLHGPMIATAEPMAAGAAMDDLQRRLLGGGEPPELPWSELGEAPHVLRPGLAEGRLVGGNLSMVCALIGTPWQIDTTGSLLVLEEVGELPYRVDRMLTQLRSTGALTRCAGVVLGDFHIDETPLCSLQTEMARVLEERLGDLGCPVAMSMPFGHRPESWSLPIGVRARLDATDPAASPTLRLLEAAVE